MGITLHGIIEVWIEKTEHTEGHWENFATVEFNKDSNLREALRPWVTRERKWNVPAYMGAPEYARSARTRELAEDDVTDASWVTTAELEMAIFSLIAEARKDGEYEPYITTARATYLFMRRFESDGRKPRLLFYSIT